MAAKILIVDDDASIVFMLKENLQGEGYQVLEGYDGQAALQLAQANRPDLIIMDMNMPGINGMQALERLRNQDQTRPIPILFLTGEAGTPENTGTKNGDRVGHLKKPIELERLNSIVHDFLSKYPVK